jgi:VWFA-related protein
MTIIVISGLLAAASLPGQDKPQRPLRYDAAAVVKLISVRVIGPDGRPVTDLQKKDFVLYEDGQPKAITEFEVHALTDAGMTVQPPLPRAVEPVARETGIAGRKIFLFLDQQASDEAGKAKARTAALQFLDTQVRPVDQVAVIGFYAMSGFFIREYLTSDLDRIRRAINTSAENRPSWGEWVGPPDDNVIARFAPGGGVRSIDMDGRSLQGIDVTAGGAVGRADMSRGGAVDDDSPGAGMGGAYVPGTAAFQRVDFVPRMMDLVEVFKTVPGNKSLVLFTSRNLGSGAAKLGQLLGAAGTTVYTVNTQDWKMSPMGTMKVHFIWYDHTLKDLAEASGGRYFADINEAEAIARDLQSLTGNYYVLGYYVSESWEGKYHKIRVEAARPGARVLAQDGYADPKPFAEMSDFEKDVELVDLVWADRPTTSFQSLAIDPLIFAAGGGAQACLLARLEINARSGVPPGPNEIYAFLRAEDGAMELSRRWEMDFSKYDGKTLWAYTIVPAPVGAHDLRILVRDLVNGEVCIGRAAFRVPAREGDGLQISSPLFFEPGAAGVYMRMPSVAAAGKKPAPAEPSLLELYRLIPKEGRLVGGETSPGVRSLTAVIPFLMGSAAPDELPLVSVTARLLSKADGGETVLDVKLRDHRRYEGRPDVMVVEIALPAAAAGPCDLELAIEDVETGQVAVIRKAIALR